MKTIKIVLKQGDDYRNHQKIRDDYIFGRKIRDKNYQNTGENKGYL